MNVTRSAAEPTIASFRSIHAKSVHINIEKNVQFTVLYSVRFSLSIRRSILILPSKVNE